jgi:hypothetical protein
LFLKIKDKRYRVLKLILHIIDQNLTGMRYLLAAIFCFSAISYSYAQEGQPAFGKIEKADIEMQDCSFDRGADAVVLIDYGNVFYRGGGSFLNTVFERRVRIKILNTAGLSYANVSISTFDQNNEEILKNVVAYTFNLEGNAIKRTKVSKSSFFKKKLNKQYSAIYIAFPNVKVGTVIEYKYTIQMQSWQQLKDWYFQGRIPTLYSEYKVNIPSAFRFTIQPIVVDSLSVKESISEEYLKVEERTYFINILHKSYSMHNLKGIHDEPFMGSARDYMQRLEFQLSQIDYGDGFLVNIRKTWSDIITLLKDDEDFGKQLEVKIPGADNAIERAKKLSTVEEKVKFIFAFVKHSMAWNNEYSIYSEFGIALAWGQKTGSTADINLLLVNLLNKAGVESWPILFSTRDNGLVNTSYPFLRQFNTVMAYVMINRRSFVLDATDRISDYRLAPEKIVNTSGLLIGGNEGQWAEITDVVHKFKITSAVKGMISPEGVMNGTALVNSYEYAKRERAEAWNIDRERFREDYFSKPNPQITLNDLSIGNLEVDSLPLEQKVLFTYPLERSGDYRYFTINLFSGLEKNPFTSEERVSDVDFGYTQDYLVFGSYTIPQGFAIESLPENLSMAMPDNSVVFNRNLKMEDNILAVRITVSFKRNFYAASSYKSFADFYKKISAKLSEPIVIKRK